LRGRLPDPDWLSVEAIMDVAIGEAEHGACQAQRADSIVATAQDFNRRWREYVDQRRRRRRR